MRALECIIDRFGAYLNHLITLSEDSSTKPANRQKLKGYVKKWRESRILLGCAVYHDILKPVAILCKCLQSDELCVEITLLTPVTVKAGLWTADWTMDWTMD